MRSPYALALLLLAGLALLSQAFLLVPSSSSSSSARSVAASVHMGARGPAAAAAARRPSWPLHAAADGSAGVGAVESCRRKIQEALSPVQLVVKSSDDDPNGSHVALRVVAAAFEGKNRVQRQQMVYKAIWEELQGPIHAVDELVCRTPAEEGM